MLVQSKKQGDLILFTTLIAFFTIRSTIHQPSLWIVIVAALLWGYVIPKVNRYRVVKKPIRLLLWVIGGVVGGAYLINCWGEPSFAVLLSGAQDFFAGQLTTAADDSQAAVVNLIFNVARGLFILYLIVAFINAWNSSRQDEDWIPVIKVPVISILAIFGLDILTSMVIP